MAVGGYKSVSFSWQGGRTDTPVDRTKFVLNGICDAIISANVGWQLDTLTPTSTDFIQMPSTNQTNFPNLIKVLKLEYNSHVYRLGVGYLYRYNALSSSVHLKEQDCSNTKGTSSTTSSQNGIFNGGLFFGFIKDGTFITDVTYGAVWDGNGLFTKWVPISSTRASQDSAAYDNRDLYSYYIVLKNAQICIFFRSSSWTSASRLKGYVVGEIFKETGHSSDLNTVGIICLFTPTSAEYNADTNSVLINSPQGSTNFPATNDYIWQNCAIKSDGTALTGDYLTTVNPNVFLYRPYIAFDKTVVSNEVSSTITSPGGRWTPCYMAVFADDHDTYGVVPGDGFKGYVDTDLLRGVNPNYGYGQQLDGGNFVYLGGGFAIGWDPNNTVLLF